MKFSGKVGTGPMNKWLNFGGDPDHRLDTRIVFRIRQYWEIRKVINGHKSPAHTDSPNGGTGKRYLGGGIHCPDASSLTLIQLAGRNKSRCLFIVWYTVLFFFIVEHVGRCNSMATSRDFGLFFSTDYRNAVTVRFIPCGVRACAC